MLRLRWSIIFPRKRASTENDSHDSAKMSKIESVGGIQLTDLNCDCLLSILKFLNLHDALKMCIECDAFVEPANTIFRRKFGDHTFKVNYSDNQIRCGSNNCDKTCICFKLDWWKYFGQSISKLKMCSFTQPFLQGQIVQYCTELKELTVTNHRNEAPFASLSQSFDKLEVLSLWNCLLSSDFCQFNKWFPNLRILKIMYCEIEDYVTACIPNMAKTMDSLESLNLGVSKRASTSRKKSIPCNVDDVIKANKHVKSLGLNFGCAPRDVRLVQKEMKQLQTLELRIKVSSFKKSSVRPINFKSVKKLVLNIDTKVRFWKIPCPMTFEMLEELEIKSKFIEKRWLFFAESNELKKLKLTLGLSVDKNVLLRISSTWPSLIEVTISKELNVDLIEFIKTLPNLQRFNFLETREIYEWQVGDLRKYKELIGTLPPAYKVIQENIENPSYTTIIRQC